MKKTIVGKIDPEVLAFTVGRDPELDLHLIDPDCIGTAAHVTMLARMPLASPLFGKRDLARVIVALVEIMRDARRGSFRITDADQDVHLAVERVLTKRLGDLGKRVHTGRSRNDQVAVDLRLFGKEHGLHLLAELVELCRTLLRLARRHASVPMVGRTHMQPAMPSSVGLWASSFAELLLDDASLVQAACDYTDRCPLGSAAGYGVPLPIDRGLTARLLGFKAPIHNVLCAANSRGKSEVALLSALSQVMLTLSRLAEDLILFTAPEFGYFGLPGGFTTGSSIMPQKKNPDVPELIRAKAARVTGDAATAANIVRGLPSGYNRDLQEVKGLYIEGMYTTRMSVRILSPLMAGLRVFPEALARGFGPEVFATDRAVELVAGGESFRDAYREVRESLSELRAEDPRAALAKRTHLGATGGLDFDAMAGRAKGVKSAATRELSRYYRCVSKLLGAKYPALHDD